MRFRGIDIKKVSFFIIKLLRHPIMLCRLVVRYLKISRDAKKLPLHTKAPPRMR